jgi:hypothetical protein
MAQPRSPSLPDTLERTRYFSRQTVLPTDLNQDREYLIHKARRHNRVLHGWGIWTGLKVEKVPNKADPKFGTFDTNVGGVPMTVHPDEGTWVAIAPGYALTPVGDEVYLAKWLFVNTAYETTGGELVTAPARCHDRAPRPRKRSGATMILVVTALEDETRPVRAAGHRCGDHPDQFEFSRLEDTLSFQLLPSEGNTPLPKPYQDAGKEDTNDAAELARRAVRVVTGTVRRSFVGLVSVTFDAEGKVTSTAETEAIRDVFERTVPDAERKPPESRFV